LKPTTTVIADRGQITYPSQSQQVDYEGELAIVIGSRTKNCALKDAHRQIWGYTIGNDVTARDLQRIDNQWVRAKGFDTFCPLGPWIVREISPSALLQTRLNDRVVQSSPISDMVFSPDAIVAYVSQIMTLLPGDVILTGTPSGIGPMQVGDRVQIEIEGLGILENSMV
jgi:2-keto-4-pentenoate hydratase/2-oxohepta-3-ene-1,7-dioic acid hydratase in catechol pathway